MRALRWHPSARRWSRTDHGREVGPAAPDEPSAGLTRDERDDLARFILRIKPDLKLPMIWIEHDMQMAADLADRIHVLSYGRTLARGTPGEVLSDPAVISAYLGVRG